MRSIPAVTRVREGGRGGGALGVAADSAREHSGPNVDIVLKEVRSERVNFWREPTLKQGTSVRRKGL